MLKLYLHARPRRLTHTYLTLRPLQTLITRTRPSAVYTHCLQFYRGTSLTRKRTPLGPCRRPMSRVRGGVPGGYAISNERGSLVSFCAWFGGNYSWTVDRACTPHSDPLCGDGDSSSGPESARANAASPLSAHCPTALQGYLARRKTTTLGP